ncbi:MAG: hypothetical protein ACI8WB_005122 [Phenylobacterium sp.]|jgi:hypothetical protein
MKIQKKLMALVLSMGIGISAAASTANAASDCCYDLCSRSGPPHAGWMIQCLDECRTTSARNGHCYLP